jgi:hypothetical protein
MLQPIMQIALTVFMGRDIDGIRGGKQEVLRSGWWGEVGEKDGPRIESGEDLVRD